MLLIVAGIVSKVAHQEWSILLTTRVIFVTSAVNGQAGLRWWDDPWFTLWIFLYTEASSVGFQRLFNS